MLDMKTKLKMAEARAGISETELAKRLGTSPQALNQRLKTGKFTPEDLEKIAEALGAEFVFKFRFPDGTEI